MIELSVLVFITGGVWALSLQDPRIAASSTTIAYLLLLLAST